MSTRVARSMMYSGSASVPEGMGANLVLTKRNPVIRLLTQKPRFEVWLHMDNGVVFVSDGNYLPHVWWDLLDLLAKYEDFPMVTSESPWDEKGDRVGGESDIPRLNPHAEGIKVVD